MSSGQGAKETSFGEIGKVVGDVTIASKQKKKRPRVRNRPRNKSNVLSAAAALANANSAPNIVPLTENQAPPQLNSESQPKIETKPVRQNQPEKLNKQRNQATEKPTKSNNKSESPFAVELKPRTASQSSLCGSPTKTEKPNGHLSTPGPNGKASTTSRLARSAQSTAKPPQSPTKVQQSPKRSPQIPINPHSPLKYPLRTANSQSPSKSASSSIKPLQSPVKPPGKPTRSQLITVKPPSSPTKSTGSSSNSASSSPTTPQSTNRGSVTNTTLQNSNTAETATKPLQSPTDSLRTAEQHSIRICEAYKYRSMSPPTKVPAAVVTPDPALGGKSREEIMAEREAKKLAKQAKKAKSGDGATQKGSKPTVVVGSAGPPATTTVAATPPTFAAAAPQAVNIVETPATAADKAREQIKAEREAKKLAKQALKASKAASSGIPAVTEQLAALHISDNVAQTTAKDVKAATTVAPTIVIEDKKKLALSKAERRAVQEAQRAAKAQILAQKSTSAKKSTSTAAAGSAKKSTAPATPARSTTSPTKNITSSPARSSKNDCKVKLFNHLETTRQDVSLYVNDPLLHPSISRLGEQYAKRTVVGSNARCIAFLNALKMVIQDFETPPKKEFARSLEITITHCVEHLQKCRPLAVSVSNAYKHIKHVLTQLPTDQPESELKNNLCRFIETYIENQIEKAAEAISCSMQKKISDGDVILTFGCSSLINYIFEEAQRRNVDFRVIVVDSRPFCEGQELLRRLTAKQIPCSYVLINAIGFIMPEATKVLLGAHALLANGYVMARTGTAQVALVAHSFNVPVLVCCETHKFSERFQTDAIVYNELGNPDDLILDNKCCLTNWQAKGKLSPLNLMYDITPSELVTAVVTEVSILPCTSVPVILRIKPTEIGYS